MSGVFARLGYNYSDANNIVQLPNNVIDFLNTVPKLLDPWQEQDIADNIVDGYYVNPVADVTNDIIDISALVATYTTNTVGISSEANTLLNQINLLADDMGSANGSVDEFLQHTNKISGVTPLGSVQEDDLYPYFVTALTTGQGVMYLTFQTDNVQNNAPILGSFTSLFVESQLEELKLSIQNYPEVINNSITTTVVGSPPFTTTVRSSDLSVSELQDIYDTMESVKDFITTRKDHDINFFRNSNDVLGEMGELRILSQSGQTADNLFKKYIGTSKLLSRLP